MRNNKEENKEDMEKEYVSEYVPDMAGIIDFIKEAKGKNRTMAQFAEALSTEENVSVSASTLSRIVNMKKAKPLSVELIKAMVNKAENPNEINFRQFMRANGMIPKEEHEEKEKRRRDRGIPEDDNPAKYENEKRDIRNVIVEELNARGYMTMVLRRIPREDNTDSNLLLDRYWSNFVVHAHEVEPKYSHEVEPKYWGFHIFRTFCSDDKGDRRKKMMEAELSNEVQSWAWIFLTDLWEPERFSDSKIKTTFLFIESDVFELFCDKLQKITVNTNISAMLIDLQKREIVSEVPFKRRDGKVVESWLDKKKIEFDSFDDEDVDFY